MARKSATRHSGAPLRPARQPAKRASARGRPAAGRPEIPDYDEELTDEQLRQIKEAVRQDIETEELEVVDGPAW